jgi:cell wall-associated NlpC family hydrolase
VNGSLATAVANQQKQEAIQAAAQAAAAQVIKQAQQQSDAATSSNPAATVDPTDAANGNQQGLAAVHAAESQIGVPYVWSGSSPGYGFDCSGLTMWAWGQAGVNLPHSAEDQYYSVEHIPFSELQPGDLIFYAAGGYIYHVIMYVGNGQAIQAEQTGTTIAIAPVWPGAFAAGRP